MLRNLAGVFMALALIGLALSIAVHVSALLGVVASERAMVLHVAAIVNFFPAVLAAMKMAGRAPRVDFWKIVLSGCPAWMRKTAYAVFGYALLNFALFLVRTKGAPQNEITMAQQLRGFSGHWIAFNSASFAILYSFLNRKPQPFES